MTLRLRPYQVEDVKRMTLPLVTGHPVRWLVTNGTGTGKTVIAIVAARVIERDEGLPGYVLVVASKTIARKWAKAIAGWWPSKAGRDGTWEGEGSRIKILRSASGKKGDRFARNRFLKEVETGDIIITNYEMVRLHRAWFWEHPPHVIVVDECHRLRNRKAQVTQAVFGVEARHRILMTATPSDGKPFQYWTMLHYIAPDDPAFRSFWKWSSNFCLYTSNGYSDWVYQGSKMDKPEVRDLWHRQVGKYIVHRSKEDVLPDLPPMTTEVVELEMESEQQKAYSNFVLTGAVVKEDGSVLITPNVISQVTRLLQTCINPAIYGGKDSSVKFDYILDAIEGATRPVCVFSHWTTALRLLHEKIKERAKQIERRIKVVLITGEEDEAAREKAYEEVNHWTPEQGTLVCLYSKAGGEGIDLIGSDYLINLSYDWSSTTFKQIHDRLHRIGQTRKVRVDHLVVPGSIEEHVLNRLRSKEAVNQAMLVREIVDILAYQGRVKWEKAA